MAKCQTIEIIAQSSIDILDINEPFGENLMVWEVILSSTISSSKIDKNRDCKS